MPLCQWTARRVVVTGGGGFIGRHLVHALLDRGAEVTIIDDFSTGHREELGDGVRIVEACITDTQAVAEAVATASDVFHLAAIASVPECETDPARCWEVNVNGTAIVTEAATNTAATLVFASSCAVYGDAPPPCHENTPSQPMSVYARSKLAGEDLILEHPKSTALRFFNIVGPGQRPDVDYAAAVPIFMDRALSNRPLVIHGDGNQTRDLVPVSLAIEALIRAADAPAGCALNVGTGVPCSILELANLVSQAAGRPLCVSHGPAREADIRESWADITRLRATLGLPKTSSSRAALTSTLESIAREARQSSSTPSTAAHDENR